MARITWSELVSSIPSEISGDPIHPKYVSWSALAEEDEEKLRLLGELVPDDGVPINTAKEYPSRHNYWLPDAPIALGYYPYNGCDVYQYGHNGGIYLVYTEYGGHVPEKRCRLVQRQLIVSEKP